VTPPAPIDVGAAVAVASSDGFAAGSVGDSCAAIEAPGEVAMQQHVKERSEYCLPGTGDGTGMLAFPRYPRSTSYPHVVVEFVATTGAVLGDTSGTHLGLPKAVLQQPSGAIVVSRSYLGPHPRPATVSTWDTSGSALGATWLQAPVGEGGRIFGADGPYLDAFAPDPGGGALFAGDLRDPSMCPPEGCWIGAPVFAHAAIMLAHGPGGPEIRWGPVPLDSDGAVMGVGVDLLGRSLVLTDGEAEFGPGTVAAQWLERDGTPLTCAFALLSGYAPTGEAAWLEATPRVGSGLVVRRIDVLEPGDGTRRLHSEAVAVVESGAAAFSHAPAWMVARPDAALHVVRGGRAYAALPLGARDVPCTQRVEVLAPDGTPCGARDYPIADGTCTTLPLTVAADGTLIQQLPRSMETTRETVVGREQTCTWRWWAGALR
jgi:hypothetical protein